MAVTSTGTVTILWSSDINANYPFALAENTTSAAAISNLTLTTGANTITLPTGVGTIKNALIIPPTGNSQTLTLKGVTGDTGVPLSPTAPTLLSFPASPSATFCITAGGAVTGLKIWWS